MVFFSFIGLAPDDVERSFFSFPFFRKRLQSHSAFYPFISANFLYPSPSLFLSLFLSLSFSPSLTLPFPIFHSLSLCFFVRGFLNLEKQTPVLDEKRRIYNSLTFTSSSWDMQNYDYIHVFNF